MEKNNTTNYHEQQNKENIVHLREILATLPPFCGQYFRGMQEYIASRTRVAYAYDIRVFFEYLHDNNPIYGKKDIKEYTIDILDQITRMDIEEYLEYCSYYVKDGKEYMNDERGKPGNWHPFEASIIISSEMNLSKKSCCISANA